MLQVDAGTCVGFKALPHPLTALPNSNGSDWSALYPQFTLEQAVAYAPNQWERGHAQVQIVALTLRSPLTLFLCNDTVFQAGTIDGATKAARLRAVYTQFQAQHRDVRSLLTSLPLLDAFGAIDTAVVLWDATTPELVLPHALTSMDRLHVSSPLMRLEETIPRACLLDSATWLSALQLDPFTSVATSLLATIAMHFNASTNDL
ncbi:hypothetical protein SPRG_06352 [Saprolegnia parasitica CBS 223.65]|uniref:Uncharacterized protein n=1 Tax=Saprolegnia parasitica (strain CBS 223.65) TaxID=695850 RepID=A0A067CNB5_SAPPC|nr:hypothetical protein SPRG_06352 [Saprolegnia parasitica CBS 223.65]KDO28302.1 hypothetical protein SPRG_06352 [Saprolegnia parasitica CBS 223.65]|eukprot:XP_012201121.1 hypothetical protein SPRG_06352 [Saprolegnia parasitica CBS 223.65]